MDENFAENAAERYRGLVPAHARLLLGPRYALLRPECAEARQRLPRCHATPIGAGDPDTINLRVRRVLIFFGATDPDNLSGRALEALTHPDLAALSVDLVVGANNLHHQRLAALADARGNTRLHPPRTHLADLLADADLAIGAGGTTTCARCCLGLPSLVVSIAENQRPACEALAAEQRIPYLGHKDEVTVACLGGRIRRLMSDAGALESLPDQGKRIVDGEGVARVIRALQSNTGSIR